MKKFSQKIRLRRPFVFTVGLLALFALMWLSCGKDTMEIQQDQQFPEIELSADLPEIQAAMAVQDRHTEELMSNPDVVGTGTGMTIEGLPAVLIFVKNEATAKNMPTSIEGVPVEVLVTGEVKELKGPPGGGGGGFNPRSKHRPAPNGVSIGHPDITAGTLGCLVSNNNGTYILSNNHVMANENLANNNDPIFQPGPFDGGGPGDVIATLSDYVDIVFSTSANNVVDAAIAAVDLADVTGATVTYGVPNTTTSNASINMRVEKYGRTTEDTRGRVQGINVTVNVGYDSGTARFVNQIAIGGGGFSQGGDSGSLIVVQKGGDKGNPVGLLFAGGGGTTFANEIDEALDAFNVNISQGGS